MFAAYRFIFRVVSQHFRSYPPFSSWYSRTQREAAPTVGNLLTEPKIRDESSDPTQCARPRKQDVSRLQVTMD